MSEANGATLPEAAKNNVGTVLARISLPARLSLKKGRAESLVNAKKVLFKGKVRRFLTESLA